MQNRLILHGLTFVFNCRGMTYEERNRMCKIILPNKSIIIFKVLLFPFTAIYL